MKIFDCFMYFDEEIVLDLRLNTLNEFVDFFVIVESIYNHKGEERKLLFDLNKFKKFEKKIIYLVYKENPKKIDKAPSGRMYLDGNIAVGENSQSIKERKNLSLNGYLEITLILNNSGKLSKPVISYRGIPESRFEEKIIFEMEDEIFNTCKTFSLKNKNQEKNLIEMVKQNCRRIIKDKTGKKPFTNINIARV